MAEDALAFRILRLAKPALGVQRPLKFQLDEDMTSDSVRRTTHSTASSRGYKEPFADRAQLQTAIDACGVSGLMVLSKSFGDAYLGEVELQTVRQKVVLYDNSTAPLPFLAPGSRHDFIIQHDIKELGVHSLICSTVYTGADGERRYTPETFKFTSANPLYVKTKTRQVGGDTLMEACIENYSKGPMVLEYVRFDAAPPLTAVSIDIRDVLLTDFMSDNPLGSYIDQLQPLATASLSFVSLYKRLLLYANLSTPTSPQVHDMHSVMDDAGQVLVRYAVSLSVYTQESQTCRAKADRGFAACKVLDVGCGHNYLFRLTRGGASEQPASSALGKLEIKWRGSLGEVGRLQTQQILGPPLPAKEVELKIVFVSDKVQLERPFQAVVKLQSNVDRQLGPLTLAMAPGVPQPTKAQPPAAQDRGMLRPSAMPSLTADSSNLASANDSTSKSIVACGVTSHTIDTLAPRGSTQFTLSLLPLSQGVQQLSGLVLQGSNDGRVYDRLQPFEVLVGA